MAALGFVLFALSLGFAGWTYAVPFGVAAPDVSLRAFAVDGLLVTGFALHHSLFARPSVKQWLALAVPAGRLRSVYVSIASLLLAFVCLSWRPIGGTLYQVAGVARIFCLALQIAGLWLIVSATRAIDPLELAGVRPPRPGAPLVIRGPYRFIRHPLYLGWALLVFASPHLTGDRLAFAALTSLYVVMAIPWEERDLRQAFGDAYEQYRKEVRWRLLWGLY